MATPKIALRLGDRTPQDKVGFAESVVAAIANNPAVFTTPNPALPSVTTAKSNLDSRLAAISAAESSLESIRTLARGEETALDALLTQLAAYVENKAKGDAAVIQLAGFDLADEKSPIGPLPPPENLQGTPADIEGEVGLKWNRVRGAMSYIVECATSPNGPWSQVAVSTRASCTASGLVSGTKYWFRVRAVGAAGPSGWSDPAAKMAA